MADKMPEGHMQMGGKWASIGVSEDETPRRRSRATTTPVVEPAEETEESTEEEAEEDTSDEESTEEEATEEEA